MTYPPIRYKGGKLWLMEGLEMLNSDPGPVPPTSSGLADPPPYSLVGVMANKPNQSSGLFNFQDYQLAVVEFDDQGRCYLRQQMKEVADWLSKHGEIDAIIVVFVHGWKHSARTDDDNLESFQKVLMETVQQEKAEQAKHGNPPRPILGVFVGWRGLSFYDRFGILENLTFWGRQAAGRRVAVGSVRELFGRFRHYRNHRKDRGGAPLLVIVGHSFGGMVVYSALAQSLIEAASTTEPHISTRFADLVLLVNPAFEAERYLPIHDLLQERPPGDIDQPPVFVCATATNDWATGIAFPVGNAYCFVTESWRGTEERQAMINTMGHLDWLTTHDLKTIGGIPGYELEARTERAQQPYWVVSAAPTVINGHDGIFQPPFLKFVAQLVFAHVSKSIRGKI
jgi:pimeloyl-ACP methyl ester carboxylesterase